MYLRGIFAVGEWNRDKFLQFRVLNDEVRCGGKKIGRLLTNCTLATPNLLPFGKTQIHLDHWSYFAASQQ